MASICVLGLGKMGAAMSRRLRAEGYSLVVWNRTFQKAQLLAQEAGPLAIAKASLDDAMSSLAPDGLIMSVMSDTPALLELLTHPALVKGLPGRVLANMSSASPDEGREIAKAAQDLGVAGYLDCAYCGPPQKVLAGAGAVFASSDTPGLVEQHTPMLSRLGNVTDCGKVGASRALDYGVVDLAFVNFLSFASNLEMMQREGVDPKIFYQQAALRLATVPAMFESSHARMGSRDAQDYLTSPTATLENWRAYWGSRLPYMRAHRMNTRVPDFAISLLEEAAGPGQEHQHADITRLQEVVRYESDGKDEQSAKRARKD